MLARSLRCFAPATKFGRVAKNSKRNYTPAPSPDSSVESMKVFHLTGTLLAVHLPIAFCGFMPEVIQNIADQGLSVLFPLHGFLGMNFVITDYVPKAARSPVRILAFLSMVLAFGGMARLNLSGNPGVAKTVKHMWMKPKTEAK